MYSTDDMEEGLYSFQHHEYQIFYIVPGDSIMLRVNTAEFDESLTYSGKGADRNNFLMEMFLLYEEEGELMPKLYPLDPSEFQQRLDSLQKKRMVLYDEFVTKHRPVKKFKKVALANINYDFYTKKELYTSANLSQPRFNDPAVFPSNFYDYREDIDFGDDDLRTYYPYFRFLNLYFDNVAFKKYKGKRYLNRNSFDHNYHKIHAIDSLVSNDSLRNSLIKTNMFRYLINAKDDEKESQIVRLFEKTNNNPNDHKEVKELAAATMKLTPGNPIPNVLLVSTENTVKDLQSIIKKPTVLFFWSSQSIKHYRNIHVRASELRSKYPEYDIIGINTDTHFKQWLHTVKKSGYDLRCEYQMENVLDAEKKLVLYNANKTFILSKTAQILEGNTNIYHPEIEIQMLGYLNR